MSDDPQAQPGAMTNTHSGLVEADEMLAAISTALISLQKRLYGKGPTRARTYINDCYVFCVLEGGITRNEETLLEAGEAQLVRTYRLRYQEAVAPQYTGIIEQITGRRVLGYHSQIVFEPPRTFEIFVLDEPPKPAG
jgi:uncharacterized protein YbcI